MRTTLNIDDDLMRVAKALAEARKVSIGRVISDLTRKGLSTPAQFGETGGFPVFTVSPSARPITLEDVRTLEDEA